MKSSEDREGDRRLFGVDRAVLSAGIVVVGVCLRVYPLLYKTIWLDEAYSIELARQSVVGIIQGCSLDVHPPLYYFALHFWMEVFGRSAPAVGALSVLFDVAALVLVLLWGRLVLGERASLALGLLIAVSPVFITFSSLVRMYTLLNALVLASFFGLIDYLRARGGLSLIVWWGATQLGLLTHYSFFAILGVQVVYVLAFHARERELLGRWLVALILIVVLFAPWGIVLREQASWASERLLASGRSLADIVRGGIDVAASGIGALVGMRGMPIAAALLILVPLGMRSGAGTALSRREKVLALLWILGSMAFYGAAGKFFRPYAALHVSVALFVLIVPAIAQRRVVASALLAAAVGLNLVLLAQLFAALPEEYRDWRWKGISAAIEQGEQPGDCIIVNACFMSLPLKYYYRGALPIYGVYSDFDVLRTHQVEEGMSPDRPLTPEAVDRRLSEILGGHRRVWLVEGAQDFTDPKGYIREALFRRLRLEAQLHWDGRFELYLLDRGGQN